MMGTWSVSIGVPVCGNSGIPSMDVSGTLRGERIGLGFVGVEDCSLLKLSVSLSLSLLSVVKSPVKVDGPMCRYGSSSSKGSRAWPRVPSDALRDGDPSFDDDFAAAAAAAAFIKAALLCLSATPEPCLLGDRPRSLNDSCEVLVELLRGKSFSFMTLLKTPNASMPSSGSICSGG